MTEQVVAPSAARAAAGEGLALLVVDVQRGLLAHPVFEAGRLLDNICGLIERAHTAGAPVVFIQHCSDRLLPEGSEAWQVDARLVPAAGDHFIRKRHGNAFEDTPLAAELAALGVGTVVVCGLVSHGCVKATAEGALARGYRAILAQDGHSNYHRQARATIDRVNDELRRAGAEVMPAAEIKLAANE